MGEEMDGGDMGRAEAHGVQGLEEAVAQSGGSTAMTPSAKSPRARRA